MTDQEVLNLIVRALAPIAGLSEEALTEELTRAGQDWPYDSLVLAELLVALEEDFGVTVPMNEETARALRTVKGLARRIAGLREVAKA